MSEPTRPTINDLAGTSKKVAEKREADLREFLRGAGQGPRDSQLVDLEASRKQERFTSPSGRRWRTIGIDERVDVRKLTEDNGGKPPRFVALHKGLADRYGVEQAMEFAEVGRQITADLTIENDGSPEFDHVVSDAIRKRVEAYRRISLAQGLLLEYPTIKATLDEAKIFKFDQKATERVVELSKTDWREWLPRAVNPFFITLFEFDSDHFRVLLRKQGDATDQALDLVGITGALMVGGHVIPLQKTFARTHPVYGYAFLPSVGSKLTKAITLSPNMFGDAPDFPNRDDGKQPWDAVEAVWGDKEYTEKFGRPEDMDIQFMVEGAAAAMRWGDTNKELGTWAMAVGAGSVRRALAAMALVNAERPVIELGRAGGRDGRTLVNGKSVPRYTAGPVRIIPDTPRVERERGEPDPDREPIHKALHDVRSHTRTYHRGTPQEFTITIPPHQRGDSQFGNLAGSNRSYAVGPTVVVEERPAPAPRVQEDPNRFAPSEATADLKITKQEWGALLLSEVPRVKPRPVLSVRG